MDLRIKDDKNKSLMPPGEGYLLAFHGKIWVSKDVSKASTGDLMLFGNNTEDAVVAKITDIKTGFQMILSLEYKNKDGDSKMKELSYSSSSKMFRYFFSPVKTVN